VRADKKVTAFLGLESTIRATGRPDECEARKLTVDGLPARYASLDSLSYSSVSITFPVAS
jgi:hypothetical protein